MTGVAPELPALLGGKPAFPDGPPGWPLSDESVREALARAHADGSWGLYDGPSVRRLEESLAARHELPHAMVCGSGTYAVELALRALKVEAGDEVALAAYDYGGNFLNVHVLGCRPVLVDLRPGDWQMCLGRLAEGLGPKTKVVIASHLHGGQVAMRELMRLAAARGFRVVEDAAQCPGAVVQGRPAGTWGDVGVMSFGGSKLVSAGRGGALLTRHADVYQRARLVRTRGNVVSPLSELQAAVVLPQLELLAERNVRRERSVQLLRDELRVIPGLDLFDPPAGPGHPGYYKVGFRFDATVFGLSRNVFTAAVRAEGVALDEGFRGLHAGRSSRRFRCDGPLSEADRAHAGAVVLHHPVLLRPDEEIRGVVWAIRKVYGHREALASLGQPGVDSQGGSYDSGVSDSERH